MHKTNKFSLGLPAKNIFANFTGAGWRVLAGLIFTPIYLFFLGIEAYALVGFAIVMQATVNILDLGLSKSCSREMARLSCSDSFDISAPVMLRTFEVLYWSVAVIIGVMVVMSAPIISEQWLNYKNLNTTDVQYALMIMGMYLAIQWPVSMYAGGLLGLEKQVLMNAIDVSVTTIRYVGAFLVLWLVSPTILAFFLWYAFVSLIHVLVLAFTLWKLVYKTGNKSIIGLDLNVLRNLWKFSAGVAATQVTSVAITQIDKIVLSKLLTLEWFGYYILANTAASAVSFLVTPFSNAFFPRFSKFTESKRDEKEIRDLYHNGCQWVAIIIFPIVLTMILYHNQILLLWTKDQNVADHAGILLALLAAGFGLNSLATLPYTMQLAYGWTSLALYQNIISLILQVPLLFLFINIFGAAGATLPRILHNLAYSVVLVPVMHTKLLRGELRRWYWVGLLKPLLCAVSACLLIYILFLRFGAEFPVWIFLGVSLLGGWGGGALFRSYKTVYA